MIVGMRSVGMRSVGMRSKRSTFDIIAGVAQLVERNLAKIDVADSSSATRSKFPTKTNLVEVLV